MPTGTDTSDILVFGGAANTTYRSDNNITGGGINGEFLLNQLQFASSSVATSTATLSGNTLQFDGSTAGIVAANLGAFTILAKLVLKSDFAVSGAGTGAVTLGRSGMVDVLSGTGNMTIGGSARVFTIFGDNGNFSGDVTLNAGTLAIGNSKALGTGRLIIASGTTLRAAAGPSGKVMNAVTINGNMSFGATSPTNSLELGGSIDLTGANRTLTVSATSNTSDTLLSGTVGNGGITKAGTGTLVLGGANTYTSGTAVNAGTLRVTQGGRLGANVTGNNVTVAAGALLRLLSSGAIGDQQTLTASSSSSALAVVSVGYDVLPSNVGSSGGITSATAGVFALDGLTYTKSLDLSAIGTAGTWSLGATNFNGRYRGATLTPGSGNTYRLGGGGGTLRVETANVITGSAALQIGAINGATALTNSVGTVVITTEQNYSGGTNVQSGTLVVVGNSALGSNNNITIAGGAIDFRTTNTFAAIDAQYAARNVTFTGSASLNYGVYNGGLMPTIDIGALTVSNPNLTITTAPAFSTNIGNPLLRVLGAASLPSTGTTTFSIGSGAGVEFRDAITGGAISKSGAGRLILSASNSISGTTTVTAGLLALHNVDALTQKLVLTAAALELRADGADSNTVIPFNVGSSGGIDISGASSINVDGLTGATRRNTIELAASTTVATGSNLTIYGGGQGAAGNTQLLGADLWNARAGSGYRLLLSGPMSLTGVAGNITFTTFGAELEISGNITGSNYVLVKAQKNNLVLSGTSIFSGTTLVDRGALIIKNNAALTGTTGIALGSATGTTLAISWNTDVFLGAGITFGKPVAVNPVANSAVTNFGTATLGMFEAGTSTFSGDIAITRDVVNLSALLAGSTSNFTGIISGAAGVIKGGLGTVVVNPSAGTGNTFTAGLTINSGTLVGVPQASGSPFGAGGAIRINAGTLLLRGTASSGSVSGHALTIAGGARIGVDSSAGGATTLTFSGLTRAGVGTLTIVPYATGTNTITMTGLTTTNGIVSPWIVRQTSETDSTGTFATGPMLDIGTYTAAVTNINSGTSTTVYRATNLTTNALSGPAQVYALTSDGQAITGAATLTVASGGVVLNNGASIGVSVLALGSSEGLVYVGGTSAATAAAMISSSIMSTNTNALTKFGPGTLTLSGPSTYAGATNVNEGTLKMGVDNALPGGLLRSVFYGTTVTIGNGAVLDLAGFNQSIGGLAGEGILLLGSGDLTVGYGNATSTFAGQYVGGAGSKLIKVGTGTLTLTNNRTDLPNSLDELVVQQGTVVVRVQGEAWSGPLDFGLPFDSNTLITLRGGSFNMRYADEVGNAHQDFTFRNNVVVAANSTLQHDRLENDGTGSKTIVMGNLTIGSQTLTTTGGGLHSMVFDQTQLTGNAVFNTGIGLALNGAITGGYTINKTGTASSAPLFIAADNRATFSGGIVVNLGGLVFGDRIGGLPVYSASANAGSGHVLLNPSANTWVRLASAANIANRLFVYSNPTQISRVEMLADVDLRTVAINSRGTGELGLGSSSWTAPIDMSLLGDGTWYLGSFLHNGEGSGSTLAQNYTTTYMADTLGVGKDNTYRFGGSNAGAIGAGGYGILAIQNANVLTGNAAVVLGAPPSTTAAGGTPLLPSSTTGTLQLNADQNYTGNTTIYRGSSGLTYGYSTLEMRGTLASPQIEVLGMLVAAGSGRFSNDGLTNLNSVILRPGSILSLDYSLSSPLGYSAVDNTALQTANGFVNKWGDEVVLDLNGATLDLATISGQAYTEFIKQIRLSAGADIRVRGIGTNGSMSLFLGDSFVRVGLATLTISGGTTATLGAATGIAGRVIFSDAADAPVRGFVASTTVNMVSPWMIANGVNSFLDYDAVNGFTPVIYTQTNNSTTFSPGASNNGTAIVDSTLNVTAITSQTNSGVSNIYALRFGNTSATAAAVTLTGGTINIFSGGLLTQTGTIAQTATIASTLYFGDGTNRADANIYTAAQSTLVDSTPAVNTTIVSGAITAANLIKAGPGVLNLTNTGNSFSGSMQVNNGTLILTGAGAATGVTEFLLGGANTTLGINTAAINPTFATLDIRSDVTATYSAPITLLTGVPFATVIAGGFGSSQTLSFAGLNFNTGNVAGGQLLNFNVNGSSYIINITGATSLGSTGTAILNNTANLSLSGGLTGAARFIKMNTGSLLLSTANSAFTGSFDVQAGTVTANNAASFGTGFLTLSGGTVILQNATPTTFAASNGILVNGTVTANIDRLGAASATLNAPFNHTVGSPTSTLVLNDAVLTVTATQSYNQLLVNSPTTVTKSSIISPSTTTSSIRFDQPVSGSGVTLTKSGIGRAYFNTVNAFTGTLSVIDGIVAASTASARFTGVGGRVEVLPGAVVVVSGKDNLVNSGGISSFSSNSIAMSGIGLRYALAAGDLGNILPNNTSIPGRGGVILLDMNYTQPINLSTIFSGDWWLGMSFLNGSMTGSITAGNDDTYRLGGGGGGNLSFSSTVLTGSLNQVLWGKPNTYNGSIAPVIRGNQTYGAGTVVSRGSITYLRSGNSDAPYGTGTVEVYGTSEWDFDGSAVAGSDGSTVAAVNRNQFVFHPGAILRFDNTQNGNMATAGVTGGRWADTIGIALNGSNLTLLGSNAANSVELVGDVTYDRGSTLTITRGSTFNTTLTANSLNRLTGGTGTLAVTYTSGALTAGSNYERITFTSAPSITNGMLSPTVVSITESQYMTYDAVTGLRAVDTAAATYQTSAASITAVSGGNKIFNIGATGTLNGAVDVYALRSGFSVSNGTASQIAIRSGGYLGTTTLTMQPNLYFGDSTNSTLTEALVYTLGTTTATGQWQAASVTKFGTGGLTMAVDQTLFNGAWVVNTGTLTTATSAGLGVNPNPVVLNGGSTAPILNFTFDGGSIDPYTFSIGKVTAFDNNDIQYAPGVVDRFATIGDIDLKTTASTPLGEATGNRFRFLFPSNRTYLTTGTVTLFDNYLIGVEATNATMGISSGVTLGGLNNQGTPGYSASFTKGGDGVLTLPDISSTFLGGAIYVSQGTLRVTSNGSLGSSATTSYVEYGGTIDIAVPDFQQLGQLTMLRGSTERWSVDGARPESGGIIIDDGVTLQLNTNLLATRTVNLNGGTVTGFLRADDDATAVFRTAGPSVTWNLIANSYLGIMNPLVPTGAGPIGDPGKFQALGSPFGTAVIGAVLELQGAITESTPSSLTKIGPDTVIISGNNAYSGGTFVREGTLQLGASAALPSAGVLGTAGVGVFDLNGYDASALQLTGTGGTIINALPAKKTLTLTGPTGGNYGGQITGRVSLMKNGSGEQILSGVNTHQGTTTVNEGRLTLSGSITQSPVVVAGGTFALTSTGMVGTGSAGSVTVQNGGTLIGTGTIAGSMTLLPGGSLTTGDDVGKLSVTGTATSIWSGSSHIYFDFANSLGAVPGTDWDYFNFGTGILKIDATATNPISFYIDSQTLDNTSHGANNFDPTQSYSWLFAKTAGIDLSTGSDDVSSRFMIFDSVNGSGVFGTNNPYSNLVGGHFYIAPNGNDLYLNYEVAAVPEPSSLLLTAFAAAAWSYRRRRQKKLPTEEEAASSTTARTSDSNSAHDSPSCPTTLARIPTS